jgi:hypothetical protein
LSRLRTKFAATKKADVQLASVGKWRDGADMQIRITDQLPAKALDQYPEPSARASVLMIIYRELSTLYR